MDACDESIWRFNYGKRAEACRHVYIHASERGRESETDRAEPIRADNTLTVSIFIDEKTFNMFWSGHIKTSFVLGEHSQFMLCICCGCVERVEGL